MGAVEFNLQNGSTGGYYRVSGGGDGYESIASREVVMMVLVRCPKVGGVLLVGAKVAAMLG